MMKPLIILIVIGTVIACLLTSAHGQQVLWGSTVGIEDCTSAGHADPLDGSFTFQVGAFFENGVPGWSPTAANTSEWADHWLAADSAAYNETFRTFTGACEVNPIFAGGQGYIWGFGGAGKEDEWILMSDPSWVFPSGGAGTAFPPSWQTSGATVSIVGTVNAPGASHHLQTQKVASGAGELPFVPSAQWLGMHFTQTELGNPVVAGWDSDADGDGLSNLLEMAIGTQPKRYSKERMPELGFLEMAGEFYLALDVKRAANVAVSFDAEVSSDLETWESGGGAVTVVSEDPSALLVRDNMPLSGEASRFMRLKVSLD